MIYLARALGQTWDKKPLKTSELSKQQQAVKEKEKAMQTSQRLFGTPRKKFCPQIEYREKTPSPWHLLQSPWQLLSKIVKAKYWTYWLLCSFGIKSVYRKRARATLSSLPAEWREAERGACYFWAYLACTFARVEPKLQPNWISSTQLALQIFRVSASFELRAWRIQIFALSPTRCHGLTWHHSQA